jgi:hypothetical protein
MPMSYICAITTTLSRVLLLCRMSHYFVVCSITLAWYSLLRRGFYYSTVGSTTPPCVPPI